MLDRARKLANILLDFYSKAMYHEYPVYDQDGKIIGYEWFATRGWGAGFDPVVREQDEHLLDSDFSDEN